MTRPVRIFLASSAELDEDKFLIENFVSRKNKDWREKRLFLELNTWRDFLSSVALERTQEQYNRYIRSADLCIFLFHTRVGRFTREEFEQAYGAFLASHGKVRKPRIYTYFKTVSDESPDVAAFRQYLGTLGNMRNREADPTLDSGHFYDTYTGMDDLLVKLGRQLDLLEKEGEIIRPERIDTGKIVKYAVFGILLPLLVLAGAVGTWHYYQPGTLLVRAHEPRGIPDLPYAKGGLTLTYGGKTDTLEIGKEALFREIPSKYKNGPARLRFAAEGFQTLDTEVRASGTVDLVVRRDSSLALVTGILKDEATLAPLAGATVRVKTLTARSDSSGYFRLVLPVEIQAREQRLSIQKDGYRPFDETVTVTRAEQRILLPRN